MKPVIIIAIAFVLLIPTTTNAEVNNWTDSLFDWHKQGKISPTEFINALGYLSDHKIGKVYTSKMAGDRNIATTDSSFDYNHPAFKNQQGGYDYANHDVSIFSYQHSNGMTFEIIKEYDGRLTGYIDGGYIAHYDRCAWC